MYNNSEFCYYSSIAIKNMKSVKYCVTMNLISGIFLGSYMTPQFKGLLGHTTTIVESRIINS